MTSQFAPSTKSSLLEYKFPPATAAPAGISLQRTYVQQTTLHESLLQHAPPPTLMRRTSAPDVSYQHRQLAARHQYLPILSSPAFASSDLPPRPVQPVAYRSPNPRPPPLQLDSPHFFDSTLPDTDLWSPAKTCSSTRSSFVIGTPRKSSRSILSPGDKAEHEADFGAFLHD